MIKLGDLMENEELCGMTLTKDVTISTNLKYHIEKQIPLSENIFRTYYGRILVFLKSRPMIDVPLGTITPP